jgi:transcriptional regulator with XRE-family HTH domain
MKIGIRIKLFINTCFESQSFFAKLVGVDRTYLNRIINDRVSPGIDLLAKFSTTGVSLEWLLNGNSPMYSANEAGEKLRKKVIASKGKTGNDTNDRVICWITENYDNLEKFCKTFQLDFNKSFNIIYESAMPDLDFLEILNQAGCNINWLQTGKGSRFEYNPAGSILMMKNKSYKTN